MRIPCLSYLFISGKIWFINDISCWIIISNDIDFCVINSICEHCDSKTFLLKSYVSLNRTDNIESLLKLPDYINQRSRKSTFFSWVEEFRPSQIWVFELNPDCRKACIQVHSKPDCSLQGITIYIKLKFNQSTLQC